MNALAAVQASIDEELRGDWPARRLISIRVDEDVARRIAGKLGIQLNAQGDQRKTRYESVAFLCRGFDSNDIDWQRHVEPMLHALHREIFVGIDGYEVRIGLEHGFYVIRIEVAGYTRNYDAERKMQREREQREFEREKNPNYIGSRYFTLPNGDGRL